MKILINCSNLKVGGGLQVAHSFLYEIKKNTEHQFIVILSDFLKYQINQAEFPDNFKFFHYSIKPSALKALTGNDKFLSEIEDKYEPDAVFSVFGPTYWQPKAKHVCGFARPDYIFKDSPFFKQVSWFYKLKLKLMEFFHMYDIRNNNEILITENKVVSAILASKVTQPVFTVSNYYNQVFDDKNLWIKKHNLRQDNDTINLLTISANYPHKNLAIIKKVIPVLQHNFPEFKFKFILTMDREEFGISETDVLNDTIQFLGKVSINQCPDLYSQSDFLFLPTLLECFSASYCEAMVMQKPILTSDLPFAKSICNNAAFYFDPLDENDIANAIVHLSYDKKVQEDLIKSGLEQLKTFDTAKQRAEKYLNIIINEKTNT